MKVAHAGMLNILGTADGSLLTTQRPIRASVTLRSATAVVAPHTNPRTESIRKGCDPVRYIGARLPPAMQRPAEWDLKSAPLT